MGFKDIEKYINNDKQRPRFLKHSLYLFGLYYFYNFFGSKSAPFHKERTKSLQSDKNVMFIGFRESGKTLWTVIYLIYCICYKETNYCLFYSHEIKLSSRRLFDIILQLKTNKRLIKDFGELFPNTETKKEDGLQKKSVSEFITTNNIKFQAMSMGMSSRGHLYISKDGAFRPSMTVFDDVDVLDSVRNPEIVNKNIEFMEGEVFGGLDSEAKIVFLGNIITSIGVVPYMENKIKEDKNRILHRKSIIENGEITRDRYVHTDTEKEERKAKGIKKISLESKQREQGEQYNPNFLLIPSIKLGNPVFDIDKVNTILYPPYTQDHRHKDLWIYRPPENDIFFGVDTAGGGQQGDYSTVVCRNKQKQLILSFKAKYAPDQLADLIVYIFSLGYAGKLVIENNSIGLATINKLKETDCLFFLYSEKSLDKITQKPTNKYGFNTNKKSKTLIISSLEENIRLGLLPDLDPRTQLEMQNYYYDDSGSTNALVGHNDDLIIAEALCMFGINNTQTLSFK